MIKIGLYASNGHQTIHQLVDNKRAVLSAFSLIERERLAGAGLDVDNAAEYPSLQAMLEDDAIDLIVLCSPRRVDQGRDAIDCLNAGKHVYAEKPCAFTEQELDDILAAAKTNNRVFHDMAGSVLDQPYHTMRDIVASGKIGEVIQVFAQKSYPYHDNRPQDEDVDGGLLMQVGIHAMRFVEHVTGLEASVSDACQTQKGNPGVGGLRMACAVNLRLENGGIATIIANYCNSRKFGSWGNEHLRIFGTRGFIESVDGGRRTHLYLNDEDCGELVIDTPARDYLEVVLDDITGDAPLPFTLEQELHPTRTIIQARAAAIKSELAEKE